MEVKICGITRPQDAILAQEEGASLVGVILYPKSPRFLPEEGRKEVLKVLRKAQSVAVMVNPSRQEILKAFEEGFNLVQLHGEESVELAKSVGIHRVIKAFRVADKMPEVDERWKRAYAVLLDTYSKDSYGGTGKTFNWDIARELVEKGFRVILSGGLKPENVREAIKRVRPFGVDVSSGVESEPGIKDAQKVKRFIKEALA